MQNLANDAMIRISIIVPVYNVERYLRKCLDSISAQTFTDWECLLIDDGSPDNSGAICDEYAVKDSRFKVFHKPNGGVSSARNLGLDMASGEWVTFIDSDDFISPTFLEGLYAPIAKGKRLDLVHGGCTDWKDGKPAGINQLYEDYIGDEPDIVFEKFRGLTVSKLFRLENVNHWSDGLPLRFDEKMKIAEDMVFTTDFLLTIKRYAFVSEVGYYYRQDNMSSATKSINKKNFDVEYYNFVRLYKSYERYIKTRSLATNQTSYRLGMLASVFMDVVFALYPLENHEKRIAKLKEIPIDYWGLLDYCKEKSVKVALCKLARNKHFIIFDSQVIIIYKLKKRKYETYRS